MKDIAALFEVGDIDGDQVDVSIGEALRDGGDVLVVQATNDQGGRRQGRSSSSAARSSSWSRSRVSFAAVSAVSPCVRAAGAGAPSASYRVVLVCGERHTSRINADPGEDSRLLVRRLRCRSRDASLAGLQSLGRSGRKDVVERRAYHLAFAVITHRG
jgi:hypothetical protein